MAATVAGERGEVDSGAERPTVAAHDDGARGLVARGAARGTREVADRCIVGGVELLGACQLQVADAVLGGGQVSGVR